MLVRVMQMPQCPAVLDTRGAILAFGATGGGPHPLVPPPPPHSPQTSTV